MHDVMAAITTAPWSMTNLPSSSDSTVTGLVGGLRRRMPPTSHRRRRYLRECECRRIAGGEALLHGLVEFGFRSRRFSST